MQRFSAPSNFNNEKNIVLFTNIEIIFFMFLLLCMFFFIKIKSMWSKKYMIKLLLCFCLWKIQCTFVGFNLFENKLEWEWIRESMFMIIRKCSFEKCVKKFNFWFDLKRYLNYKKKSAFLCSRTRNGFLLSKVKWINFTRHILFQVKKKQQKKL